MKITGTTSYIVVEIDNKKVKIQGEMIVGGFAAYSDTIARWQPPFDKEVIDNIIKDRIIREVTNYTKHSDFKIIFV